MRGPSLMICIPYILSSCVAIVKSDLFSAVASLQDLLGTENTVAIILEKYLEAEQQRIEKIKWFRKEYIKMIKAASYDTEKFLSNPINSYRLIKHLTSDLIAIEHLMTDSASQDIIRKVNSYGQFKFPDEDDLNGAVFSLLRLQDMYFLDTTTLAHGLIHGTSSLPLTSSDCFEIGRHAFYLENYNITFQWMQEALNLYEEEDIKFEPKEDILEYLSYSAYMLGNLTSAVKFSEEIVRIDPQHQIAKENLKYYEEIMANETLYRSKENQSNINELEYGVFSNIISAESSNRELQEKFYYQKLCQGKKIKSAAEESKLVCRYVTNSNSFLILQPVKEEELNLKPRLVFYHDFMFEREVEVMKNLAKPKLYRALVQSFNVSSLGDFRICKCAWLSDSDHEVVKRLSQRIEAITGLTADTSEEFQVVNYGIGGHYVPHSDFAVEKEKIFEPLGTGNRIATWINYMSDVEAGGSTVFPAIGVEVRPKKGSAAFWYNLYQNGTGDDNTRHAACPVLVGSKWISTKWFHEYGQELRRPCTLNSNE